MTHLSETRNNSDQVHTAPQTTHLEIDMESALSPREVQARVRAGDSIEDVARVAGKSIDWVEPFAVPVIAEREYIAQQAQSHQVRRGGETIAHRTLGQVVSDRLASRKVGLDSLVWDSWRIEGRRWLVQVRYESGKAHHEACFIYDANGRFSIADNDEAHWLLGLHSSAHGPQPGRRRREEEAEPTVGLNDDLALVRVVQPRADELPDPDDTAPLAEGEVDDAYAEAELAEVDGVYDIVPSTASGLDVLYDMLSSFDEDSVQIYAGLIGDDPSGQNPPPPALSTPFDSDLKTQASGGFGTRAKRRRESAASVEPPIEAGQPSLVDESVSVAEPAPESEEPTDKPRTRRKRAEVPSWDEIMFGSPKKRPRSD